MLIVGLTGSIGMGKSTAAGFFRELGAVVIDADAIVHELYREADGPAVAAIEAAFPGTTTAGGVDRVKLAQALISDPRGLGRLEAIVHPLVRARECELLSRAKADGARLAILEIPLLFETGGDQMVDAVVVVSAPAEVQRARVLERPGMSEEKLSQLLSRQMPDAEKRRRADFVVDTSGPFEDTRAQIARIVESLDAWEAKAFERYWQ